MGPQRNRGRDERHLARRGPSRERYDRVLIVTEGEKTEPNYFREIQKAFRLPTANVVVLPSERGTAPDQVVAAARSLFEHGKSQPPVSARAFDRVDVVFDRDDHASYAHAIQAAKKLDGKLRNDERQPVPFIAVPSVPCFEVWLLLHFEDVQPPVDRAGIQSRLRAHLPDYSKASTDLFERLRARIDDARKRALRPAVPLGTDEAWTPYTRVHELVDCLMTLRRPS